MENEHITPCAAANMPISLYKSFSDLKALNVEEVKKVCKWNFPPTKFLKLNVDGVVFSDLRKPGIGMVLRDSHGNVVMAATVSGNAMNDPTIIELFAIFKGLQLCLPLAIPKLIVESNCWLVVQELQDAQESSLADGNLIMEVKGLLSLFQEVRMEHVN
ncbi:uncharacterized protein LOC121245502 [Juglans microcarpa x Juglans regia]|uniref:uncharacterized protein LOC121245244 n=1 Tax=Juglans microcarpa x Juglans regia TaxID=2249226 RepID=UPI001B7E5970|nr:uncharacterized protein LOC121245244 [Juglans microcarpa x Juglans regia]XP_040999492.1 uncharacterized protein LOC121245502 [Juglans microcarpa x Juglans regia]